MKNRRQRNKKLDHIGSELFKAVALGNDDIEAISSRPHLLAGVRSRIDSETSVLRANNRPSRTFAEILWRPSFMVPAASVLLFTVVLFAVRLVDRSNRTDIRTFAPPPVAFAEHLPSPKAPQAVLRVALPRTSAYAVTAAATRTAPAARRVSAGRVEQPEQLDFYPLAGMESIAEDADTRIVRVDLPRASLYSLGVNVPLEYGTTMIKTDLLVGPDGVPHAIRPVK